MKKLFYILILFLGSMHCHAQEEQLSINNHQFSIVTEIVDNEWATKDTINTLFRIENGERHRILKYAIYQDEGGDCNNLFWNKETMEVQSDRVLFTTHYFQKNGIDPIPEWRHQIYQVNSAGEFILIYDKYKYYNSTEWVEE